MNKIEYTTYKKNSRLILKSSQAMEEQWKYFASTDVAAKISSSVQQYSLSNGFQKNDRRYLSGRTEWSLSERGGARSKEGRKIYRGATVRANQTRRGASPAQIFHSYGQINHDLSAGCTAVWGIERINDAMLKRGGYSEGGKATWIPEGGVNPPSLSPMLTHLDNGDEAIIFSAPKARYVSMRIRLSDLMWILIHQDTRSCLTSSHNDIRRATRIVSSYVEIGDYLSDDLDAARIIYGKFSSKAHDDTPLFCDNAITILLHHCNEVNFSSHQ
ncbi:Uncharacterized protein DBV15_08163 [Temnothorax longispinosus]|uniref:Uncharacterized protein n=1 Tax=Temnothorax longispinosus TaxID=300112 RepID=A0A4S2KEB4_9HYME|nr:Uncharacterized protein DBV15_08163 [Temnothorax longispinosus]